MSQYGLLLAIFVVSFILITTSVPFAAAQMGTPFLAEEIAAIEEIIAGMQDQLNNLRVSWVNVTGKPVGFANETDPGGIFQDSASTVGEPCGVGDVVTWIGFQWACLQISTFWGDIQNKPSGFADDIDNDTLSEISISCEINQIAKWNGTHWVCANETTGSDPFTDKTYLSFTKLPTSPVIDIPDGTLITNPIILASWIITNDRTGLIGSSAPSIFTNAMGIATVNNDAPTDCRFDWLGRVDGGTWKLVAFEVKSLLQVPPDFTQARVGFTSSTILLGSSFEWTTFEIAVGAFQSKILGTDCHLRDAHFSAWIEIPATATIARDI